jgi:protein O-GlcNAc transferase
MLELAIAGGARLCVPAALDQITPYVLLEQEDWFEDEIRFVRRWLRPGMRAIDVGANFGVYTLAMARAVGNDGRVWCFEPTAETADFLERSLALNGCRHVNLVRAAVSDREGSIAFSVGTQSELNAVAGPGAPAGRIVEVPAVTLDRKAAELGWQDIDMLKLDVEGHELRVIQGATQFLRAQSPLVMFEVKAGATVDLSALGPLSDMGYEFYRLLPGPLWLAPFDAADYASVKLLNVFACKPDRARRLAEAGLLVREEGEPRSSPASAWRAFVQRMPYARRFAERWPAKAGFFSGGGLASYFDGLAAYADSRNEARSANERHASLRHAIRRVGEALEAQPTLARRITFARLAWELGLRRATLDSLAQTIDRLHAETLAALAEPFLAPSGRYEMIETSGDGREWLACAVVEQFERARARSSTFAGSSSLQVLAPVRGLSPCSPEMERRWQLVRMKHGLQAGPEAVAALRQRSDENLNPQLWSGMQAFAG